MTEFSVRRSVLCWLVGKRGGGSGVVREPMSPSLLLHDPDRVLRMLSSLEQKGGVQALRRRIYDSNLNSRRRSWALKLGEKTTARKLDLISRLKLGGQVKGW